MAWPAGPPAPRRGDRDDTATAATPPGFPPAMTAVRRALSAIRRTHQELELASEALFRPVGAPLRPAGGDADV